jgi:phospholipid transport system substrate-binding protein
MTAIRRLALTPTLTLTLMWAAAPAGAQTPAPQAPAPAKPAAAKAKAAPPAAKAAEPASGSESPLTDLKKANQQLKKSFGNRKPSWSPEAEAKNADIRKIVGSFLDFDELARRALVKHWDGLPPGKRADFVKTLRELVERNYVKQLYGQPDYDLRLEREEKTDKDATVWGTLHASSKGKKITMALEYKLVRKGDRWVVYDVITDELSLLENYRAEFNKVIAKESFDALLTKMKKRLNEKT